MTRRTRRSLLYVPADEPEKIAKTADTNADGVMIDLETAVADANKDEARENLAPVLSSTDFGEMEVCVRINGLKTDWWLQDLTAAVEAGVDTVRVPMIEEPWEIRTVVETANGLNATDLEFLIMLENPQGMFAGREIARECAQLPQVTGISLGGGDYSVSIGAPDLSPPIRNFLRNMIVSYATIGDMDPIAGVYMDIGDEEGLRAFAEGATEFGFVGMSAVAPGQVDLANEVFTPPADQVAEARELVEAYDESESDVLVVDGQLLEDPIVDRYRTMIEQYEAITDS